MFFCIQTSNLPGQNNTTYSKEVRAKIKQFENNLGLWVQIGNQQFTLADRMKSNHVNGVSIALIKDYKIEWAKGYGWADSAEKRPVTTNTLFQAGSISKSLNGVGIIKLVQEGKLNLDSDINIYLKSWKFPYDSLSKGKKITIANLLSHTAGLTVHGFDGYEKGDTIPTMIQILNGEKPANNKAIRSMYEPSLKSEYSGGGTTISQLIKKGNEKYFNHDGSDEGFVAAYFGGMKNGNGAVVMANTNNGSLLYEVINSLASVYNWKGFYTPKIKKVVTVNNEILKSYVGNYKPHRDTLNVTLEKEGFMIRLDSKTKYKIYFTSDADFFMLEMAGSQQRFTKDKKINGFEINDNGYKMQAVKIE